MLVSCESGKLQSNMLIRQPSHCSRVCSMPLNTEEFDETGSSCFTTHVNIAKPRVQSERGTEGKWNFLFSIILQYSSLMGIII